MTREARWEAHNEAGMKLCERNRYVEAEERFLAALQEAEGFSPQDPRLAANLYNLATLYHDQERYAEAEPFYQRALAIMEQVLGAEHPQVTQCLHNLALLYHDQNRYEEANLFYQRALPTVERTLKTMRSMDYQPAGIRSEEKAARS